MKNCLPLPGPAGPIAAPTMHHKLCDMPRNRPPTTDLPLILTRDASAHIVATVPLEPTARIIRIDPALFPPDRKRLRRIHAKVIERRVMPFRAKLRPFEPACWKFSATVRHVFSAKHPERKHLGWRQVGLEIRMEILSHRLGTDIPVPLLHLIIHGDDSIFLRHIVVEVDRHHPSITRHPFQSA